MGYPVDPETASPLLFVAYVIRAVVACQETLDLGLFQSCLGGDVGEHPPVPDVPTVEEIGSKQRLDHGVLPALLLGVPDQPVGVEGVGRASDPVEGERDP